MKRKKRTLWIEHLRCKKGFTLLEVVLVTALVSIFFTAAVSVIPTWYRAYTKTLQLNYARQMADGAMGTIEQTLRFANRVDVNTEADGVERIRGKNGSSSSFAIPMDGSTNLIDGLVYDEAFFMNYDMELAFSLSADKAYCTVTVSIVEDTDSGTETVLEKTRAVILSGEND